MKVRMRRNEAGSLVTESARQPSQLITSREWLR